MKQNKLLWLHIVLLIIASVLLASISIIHNKGWDGAHDLILRYNEINCAHDGIDSFDIFENKVVSEKYCAIPRPDKLEEYTLKDFTEKVNNGQKPVHAYPAWHTAVFWWYGFVPQNVCIAIMAIVYICSLAWICKWTSVHLQKKDRISLFSDILFLLALTIYPFFGIYFMNYGLLLSACTLLLLTLLEHKHDVYAGIVFSFIMIKPQIGVLLLIPLFLNKNYKTIVIAGAICILETLFTAWKLDKSPVELILQLPKIGAPFSSYFFGGRMATKVFGAPGPFIFMGSFMIIVSAGCFFVRNAKDTWVRFLPAIAMVPFWAYSQFYDWIIILPCCIYILNGRQKYPRLYEFCFWALILWSILTALHVLGFYLIGKQGIIFVLHLAIVLSACFMSIMDTKDKWNMDFLKMKRTKNTDVKDKDVDASA